MTKYIKQGWLVLMLALVFGAALAGVNTTLDPKIKLNEKNATYDQVPKIVPGADFQKTQAVAKNVLQAYDKDGKAIGWVITATGMGYAGQIKALIGLNAEASIITGIYILDQKETPGLGNKIAMEKWNRQFIAQPADIPLSVHKRMTQAQKKEKNGKIDAISGATISSKALTDKVVNPAVKNFRKALQAGEFEKKKETETK